ncbi:MAG TPA: DUF4139 domain-containing protein, partial [Patescibacteria group bacterium]|nr:DUF4139 domain-containing protein [Patescibacteria group bacterium]
RAEGKARAAVKFGAVSHRQVMSAELTSEREKDLNGRAESVQDQMTALNAERAALDAQKNFITQLAAQAQLRSGEEIAQINLKPEEWTGAATTIRNNIAEINKAALELDIRNRQLSREYDRIQNEIATLRTGGRSTYAVSIPVEAEAATQLTVELSYQVPDATWAPIYDARLSTEGKGKLTLTQYGAVMQRTGEDWSNISLSLSTAQPQRGASLPDLQPMWVDAYDQNSYGGRGGGVTTFRDMSQNIVSSKGMMEMDAAAPMAAGEPPPPPQEVAATFNTAQTQGTGFTTEYKIPGPANVPADGSETKLMVGDYEVAAKLEVHIKPQLSGDAFLVAKAKLKGENPILAGQVNLFRDGGFVGQSRTRLLRPDEETDFYFGIDDQVSVKRKVLKDERQESGVIARDTVLERHYATEIQNLHKDAVDVVVKETTPAPRNEKLKSELVAEATTPGYKDNSDNIKNMLYWEFPLQPKEKKIVKLGWTLSWPKDMSVNGIQ